MSVSEHCLNSDNKTGPLFTDNKAGQLFSDDTSDQSDELARERINMTNVTKKLLYNGNKGFKIMHLNIRSLIKNIDQFRVYASNNTVAQTRQHENSFYIFVFFDFCIF